MENLLLNFGSVKLEWHTALLSFLVAFLCSSIIAGVYEKTYQGLSWSRNLVQAMVLGSFVTCLLMIAIGDNVARGIGIVGSLAIIRFRTNLRDPRDLVFLFAALGCGVAAGVQSYMAAVIGCGVFCSTAFLLHLSPFGRRRAHDGLLRFQVPRGGIAVEAVAEVLRRVPRHVALVTMRDAAQGEFVDCAYQITLNETSDGERLLAELGRVEGIRGLTYINQQTTVEV